MSRIIEEVSVVTKTQEMVGKSCDVCGVEHRYGPAIRPDPSGNRVFELLPRSEGWEVFHLGGTNGAWDVCAGCVPKVHALFTVPVHT